MLTKKVKRKTHDGHIVLQMRSNVTLNDIICKPDTTHGQGEVIIE